MKWFWWIVLVTCALWGCKSQTPTVDPFFGHATVPPPPTGAACCPGPAPYGQPPVSYQPSPSVPEPASYVGATQSPTLPSPSPQTFASPQAMPSNNPSAAPIAAGGQASGELRAPSPATSPTPASSPPGFTSSVTPAPTGASTPLFGSPAASPSTPFSTQPYVPPQSSPLTPPSKASAMQTSPRITPYGTGRLLPGTVPATGVPPTTSAPSTNPCYPSVPATPAAPATPSTPFSPTSPPAASPSLPPSSYLPPTSGANYREASLQGSRTLAPAADRSPRPVDDGPGRLRQESAAAGVSGVSRAADGSPVLAAGGTEANFDGQRSIIRTLQPRPKDDSSSQPVDGTTR